MIPIDPERLRYALERSPPICTHALLNISELNDGLQARVDSLTKLNKQASEKLAAQQILLNEIVAFLAATAIELGSFEEESPPRRASDLAAQRAMKDLMNKLQGKP